jgi:hypothetical protein
LIAPENEASQNHLLEQLNNRVGVSTENKMENKKILHILARDDVSVGWNADVKDTTGVSLHIEGDYTMMLQMAHEIAKQVKRQWPGCSFVIGSCVTDDFDDAGMLQTIVQGILDRD